MESWDVSPGVRQIEALLEDSTAYDNKDANNLIGDDPPDKENKDGLYTEGDLSKDTWWQAPTGQSPPGLENQTWRDRDAPSGQNYVGSPVGTPSSCTLHGPVPSGLQQFSHGCTLQENDGDMPLKIPMPAFSSRTRAPLPVGPAGALAGIGPPVQNKVRGSAPWHSVSGFGGNGSVQQSAMPQKGAQYQQAQEFARHEGAYNELDWYKDAPRQQQWGASRHDAQAAWLQQVQQLEARATWMAAQQGVAAGQWGMHGGESTAPPWQEAHSPMQGMDGGVVDGWNSTSITPRWHNSAESVGTLSQDGHVFTKFAGPRLQRTHDSGEGYELATICMVFDSYLRCFGTHRYTFSFLGGELGPADGAGFTFDTKVRRRPLTQVRAVFLNQRGIVCLRKGPQVSKLPVQLPPLTVGMYLTLMMDLDRLAARFEISSSVGEVMGRADVSLKSLFSDRPSDQQFGSGFFCAVVTGSVTVGLC